MVERLNGIQKVTSSNLVSSTNKTQMFFVYILQSLSTGRFYVGSCDHLIERFYEHEAGYNKFTRNRGPWRMPYYEIFSSRSEAQKREYEIKRKKSAKSIRAIIAHSFPEIKLL